MAGELLNPLLRWTDGQRDMGGNIVRPPKDVWLMERWWGDEVPKGSPYFTVHQVFDNVFRDILSHLGVATERDITRIDTVEGVDARTFVSIDPWSVAAAGGRRARGVYVFRNTSLSQSPSLIAHRFGDVKVKGIGGTSVGADVGVASVGVNGSGEIDITAVTAIDPVVRVRLLLPWERDELSLDSYAREQFEAIDYVDADEAMVAFRERMAEQLQTEIPAGLSFNLPSENLRIAEGQPVEFSIGVEAATPGRTLFALQIEDVEDAESAACSELLALEVTDDLEILVHSDTEPAGAAPAAASV